MSTPDTTHTSRQHAQRGMVYLLGTAILCLLVLAGPAYGVAGLTGLLSLLASVAVCTVAGVVVILLLSYGIIRDPLQVMLFATGFRMLVVMGVVVGVRMRNPELGFGEFYAWLSIVYLASLAAETVFLSQLAKDQSSGKGS